MQVPGQDRVGERRTLANNDSGILCCWTGRYFSEPFVLEGDEPPILLGENYGANAVEVVLHALVSCLIVGFIYNAAAIGIHVESLSFSLEDALDLHGFLGLSKQTRPGYETIKLTCRIKSDAPRDKISELCNYVQKTSPVLDIIRNAVPVTIEPES